MGLKFGGVQFAKSEDRVRRRAAAGTGPGPVTAVLTDYVPMLELGLVDDVDATLDEMIQKCYDAGLQQVYDEFYSQYDAWLATR